MPRIVQQKVQRPPRKSKTHFGVGPRTLTGVGTATGLATAAALGAALWANVGLSTGTATAPGIGAATSSGVGTATGTATAPGIGAAAAGGVGTCTGTATAPGIGAAASRGVGSAVGLGAAPGIGAGADTTVGVATGLGTAPGIGAALWAEVGTSTGTGTAPGIGLATTPPPPVAGVKIYYGVCLAVDLAAIPATVVTGTGLASGLGVAKAFSRGYGTGLAAGTGAALALGKNTGQTVGLAAGTGAAPAFYQVLGIGLAAGIGAAPGVGAGANVGLAAGFGAAPGIGGATGTSQVEATINLNLFTSVNQQGFVPGGTHGVQTNGIWCIMSYWYNFQKSDYYTFTVPACCTNATSTKPANSLVIYIDQLQLQSSTGTTANRDWFIQYIENLGAAGTGPFQNYSTASIPITAGWHVIYITLCSGSYYKLASGGNNTDVYGDSLIITDTGTPIPVEPAPQIRDPARFPLSSYHFLNTPFSTAATWSSTTDGGTATMINNISLGSNTTAFSVNNWYGATTSPIVTLTASNNNSGPPPLTLPSTGFNPATVPPPANTPVRIPPGAYASSGSDLGICLVDLTNPRYRYAIDGATTNAPNQINSYRLLNWDTYGINPAVPQSCTFFGSGIITQPDMDSGVIAHRLSGGGGFAQSPGPGAASFFAPSQQTSLFGGMPFPACESDAGWVGEYTNANGIPYGSVWGIPSTTPMPGGLTTGGQMLFTCLQNYGIFWNQSSGTYPACNIDIEGTASGPLITQIQGALNTLRPLLRMLTNPQPFTPGKGFGGVGNPVVSLLPGLVQNYPDYGEPPFSFPSNNSLIPIMGAAPYGSTNNSGIAQTGIYSIDIPVGSFVFVAFATQNNFVQNYTTVVDTSGAAGAANIYHIIQPTPTSSTPALAFAYCLKTTRDIPKGTGWTATTTGQFALFFQLMGAMYIPGVGAPALRGSSTTTGTGTTFSVGTAAQSGDLVIGLTDSIPGFGTLTDLGGFNQISYGRQTASWAWDYLLPTSSVTATYSKSWNGGSVGYQAIVAAFSGA